MAASKNLLIIFYRNPELGKVKTRLAATMGHKKALFIYEQMVKHTCTITLPLPCDKVVYYSHTIEPNDVWTDASFAKATQHGGTLGERMLQAFEKAFADGYSKVCIIGTDCLELTTEIINQAFTSLNKTKAVVGPAKDGGYYLVGMQKLYREIFANKQWSTHTVTHDTLLDFVKLKVDYTLLPLLSDVDVEEDLKGKFL